MANEIIFVCNSKNNKNIRDGELEILRKIEDKLCFEFGKDEMNLKKRFYNNIKELNEDYEKVLKIKEDANNVTNASYEIQDADMPLKEIKEENKTRTGRYKMNKRARE